MVFRRFIMAAAILSPLLAGAAQAQTLAPADAKAFITQSSQQILAIVNGPGTGSAKGEALRTLVNQAVDVTQVGDFVLGRYINVATADQHQQFQDLFHQLLSYNITFQIKAYQGVGINVNGTTPQGNDVLVDTTVTTPNKAPADVGWVVEEVGGTPKIVDVIVAGTSLRVTTRDDYGQVIADNGGQVSALLAAMKKQIARIAAAN